MMEKMTALFVTGSIALAGISGLSNDFDKAMTQMDLMFDQTLTQITTMEVGQ